MKKPKNSNNFCYLAVKDVISSMKKLNYSNNFLIWLLKKKVIGNMKELKHSNDVLQLLYSGSDVLSS